MKREINPVKIIKILPVPRGGRPPFLDPEWLSKFRERAKRLLSRAKTGLRDLSRGIVVRLSHWKEQARTGGYPGAHVPEQHAPSTASEPPVSAAQEASHVGSEEGTGIPALPTGPVAPSVMMRLADYLRNERVRLRLRMQEVWVAGRARAAVLQQAASQRLHTWREESGRLLTEQQARMKMQASRTVDVVRKQVDSSRRRHRRSVRQQLTAIQSVLESQHQELKRLSTDMTEQRQAIEELMRQLTARNYSAARGPSEGSGGHRRGVVKRTGPGEPGAESRAAH